MNKRTRASQSKVTPAVRQSIRAILDSNQEHKTATFATPSGANWSLPGSVTEVTRTIIQGDQIYQRSGDQITVKKLKIRMLTSSTGAGNATNYRVILFADMTNNGAVPAVTDVLDVADLRAAYQNFNFQRRRFKILHDKMYTNVFGTMTQAREIVLQYPKLHHKVYYNGSAAAVTDNGKGALFILVIADTTGLGQFNYLPEITYTDS
jgi:hypothetical protein